MKKLLLFPAFFLTAIYSSCLAKEFIEFKGPGPSIFRTVSSMFQFTGCSASGHPFARGYCSIERGRHGQWVRGRAVLMLARSPAIPDGVLTVDLGLETDSVFFGIAGWTEVWLRDQNNAVIARYKMTRCAIPAKRPGKARIADFSGTFSIPRDIASRVSKLEIIPHVADDNAPQPFGFGDWHVKVDVAKF